MHKVKAALIAGALGSSQVSAQSWVCIIDQSTGFTYSKSLDRWVTSSFADRNKYLISPLTGVAGYTYKVAKFGNDSFPQETCKNAFDGGTPFMHCDGLGGHFAFNKNMGRIVHSYYLGYFNVAPGTNTITDENSDTPFIEIGTCSAL